jgi:hypothetical protein
VAVLPPGAVPDPCAPRLVYSESRPDPFGTGPDGDEETRIYALALDGTRRELALGEAGMLGGARTVRDLALDAEGNVFVALSGGRGIWKITPAGAVGLHALIPEPATPPPGEGDPPDGLRTLALDPTTGNLYAGDGLGVHRVNPDGAMAAVYPPGRGRAIRPCQLALHGRELLILDTRLPEIQVLHLETRKLTRLVGSAGKGPTRLGPIQRLNPALERDSCAALGAAGALASNQEGLCLMGAGSGLALLDLPGTDLTGVPEPVEEGIALPSALAGANASGAHSLSTRQANLGRSRSIQLRNRLHKKERKLGLELAARKAVKPTAMPSPPARRQGTRLPPVRSLGRVGFWILLSVGAAAEPAPLIPLLAAQAEATLDQLGIHCGPVLFPGAAGGPCAPGYRAGVLAQLDDLFAQMDPAVGPLAPMATEVCVAGDSEAETTARIELAQGDYLARLDGLTADAAALNYQLSRDGAVLQAVGASLLSAQRILLAAGEPAAGFASVPAALLGGTGNGLTATGFGIQGLGNLLGGKVTTQFITHKALSQRSARSQARTLLERCRANPLPALSEGPSVKPSPSSSLLDGASPLPALLEAQQKLTSGCDLAARHLLALPVCSPETLATFPSRNATLSGLYEGLLCLAQGALAGQEIPWSQAPWDDARTPGETLSYFTEFLGEIDGMAWDLFVWGNGLEAGAQSLFSAANLAGPSGNATLINGLVAGGFGLVGIGDGLFAQGYDLLRIGSRSQRWQAEVVLAFNARTRAKLDADKARRPALALASSTTAATPVLEETAAQESPQPGQAAGDGGTPVSGSTASATGGSSSTAASRSSSRSSSTCTEVVPWTGTAAPVPESMESDANGARSLRPGLVLVLAVAVVPLLGPS